MNHKSDIEHIKKYIQSGLLAEALAHLCQMPLQRQQLDEAQAQSGRFHNKRKEFDRGLIKVEDLNLTESQITAWLQNFLIEIENPSISKPTRPQPDDGFPHALTPPPFKNEVFLGRETELEYIRQKLFSQNDNLLLLVNGDGGVGKTSLASRYYHDHTGAYAHQAWLLSEKNIVNALLQLAIPLGVQFDERAGPTERLEVLLPALAELNAPCLLVIDNANEVDDLDATYQYLRRLPNFHLLLTTRVTNFELAETYRIEGLPYEKALELFQKYYPKFQPGEEDLFRQIREAVAGNTLVIELLAKTLAQANRLKTRYTLADLLKDLQDKGVLQLTQSAPVRTDYQAKGRMRHETPTAIIEAMYDLSELSTEERRLLSNFAVLPAESIGFEMLETLLGEETLEPNLLSLAQKGWIEYNEDAGSFKCSPVVQEIVRRKHAGLREDCGVLVDRLKEKLKYQPGIGHLLNTTYEEALVFASYGETVLAVIDIPDYKLFFLADRLGKYYNTTGDLTKALLFAEKSRQNTQLLCLSEPDNTDYKYYLGLSYEKLGDTHRSLGNLDKALAFYEERSRLRKELYEAYPQNESFKNSLAISYQSLGNTQRSLGNLDKALTFFEDQTKLFEELYDAYPQNVEFKNGLAISYQNLGIMHRLLGNLDKALTFFEQYTQLEKELYNAYPQNVEFKNSLAISYCKRGETHHLLGNLDKALTFFEQFNQLEIELYNAYPQNVSFINNVSFSYYFLGQLFEQQGNPDKAFGYFEQGLKYMELACQSSPQNALFRKNLGISYRNMGKICEKTGKGELAKRYYEMAEELG